MDQQESKHPFPITRRDRLFLAWQASIAMLRLLKALENEEEGSRAATLFSAAAEDECRHASDLLAMLEEEENKGKM